MSVSSISTQLQSQTQSALRDKMTSALEANGLTADTASSVSSEIGTIVQTAASAGSTPPNQTAIRAAIDTQVKADVASGKLTQDQADAVTKTLDAMDAQHSAASGTSGGSAPSAPSGAAPSGGGAGSAGGSSSTKTVVSTATTTSGDKTTTVTTYSDGSTSTSVSYLPSAKSAIQSATDLLGTNDSLNAKDRTTAASYLTALLSKGVVDITT